MEIVSEILKNREFNKLKDFTHHKTTRMEHSKRVAYLSYRICKKLNLDYVSAARGGMLHDFFLNKYTAKNTNKLILLINLFGDMKSLLDTARKLVLNWVNLIYIYLEIYN